MPAPTTPALLDEIRTIASNTRGQQADALYCIADKLQAFVDELRNAKGLLCSALPEIADVAEHRRKYATNDDDAEDARQLANLANQMREALGYPVE